ncbi:MAG: tryptophan synthase subunit alpha [Candidatus Bathyarchaeota archaeon]|nr:tryptophan synthase subunit alpha [Candidatus Bathyarchaeota archaeon]
MSTISKTFENLKKQGNGALIAYVTAGDPTPEYTPQIAKALIKGGVDILELGLPFSDPIADGPTIQAASTRALDAGTKPKMVLEMAKTITKEHAVPVAVMTYYNPVFKMGLKNFFSLAKQSGVSGVITPDLPIDEATEYRNAAKTTGIDTIFLAAPSTTDERLGRLVAASSGFLYLVSRFGVTGTQAKVADSTISLVKRVLPFTAGRVPLAVGFGVSKPEHVKSILEAGADGVIVGSAFVNIVSANQSNPEKMLSELEATARTLKQATLK